MILHSLSKREECTLRVEYVNSPSFSYTSYSGYRDYAISNIPGVLEVGYRGGDDPNTIEALVFDNDKSLVWFKLRYS